METKQKITSEMYTALRQPLPKDAVLPHPTKKFLSTIKAIYVVERLNEVFGPGLWILKNSIVREDTKHIVVKSELTFEEYLGYYEAFGGNDNPDLGDAYKGACTDALTKIGSFLGVAMEVYKGQGNTAPQEAPKPQPKATPAPAVDNAAEAVKYATAAQREEIVKLLNHDVITRPEKTKMLLNVNKLDTERAAAVITKLKGVITEREAQKEAA